MKRDIKNICPLKEELLQAIPVVNVKVQNNNLLETMDPHLNMNEMQG